MILLVLTFYYLQKYQYVSIEEYQRFDRFNQLVNLVRYLKSLTIGK